MAFRRIDSLGIMNESTGLPYRQIESVGIMIEWRSFEWRRNDSIGIMVENDGPYIPISGLSNGLSIVTGNMISLFPVYTMSEGDFTAQGTLNGNVYIEGLSNTEALINGTLFGKLKLSGKIEDIPLTTSYLWGLEKLKMLSIGVLNDNGQEDGFLHFNGYNSYNADVSQNNLLGFGHLNGLIEGETYFTLRVNGKAPISNMPFATVQTKGLTLTFNQTTVTISIQNNLFTFNGKQLVFPV